MTITEKLDIISAVEQLPQFTEEGKQELIEALTDDEFESPVFNSAEDMFEHILGKDWLKD